MTTPRPGRTVELEPGTTTEKSLRDSVVLRIDRYRRQQAPADASRTIYVLDMVVESETVAK